MKMKISIEEAYATACQKVGEGIIRESMMFDILAQKDAEISELKEKLLAAGLIEEATDIVEGVPDADHEQRRLQQDDQVPGENP